MVIHRTQSNKGRDTIKTVFFDIGGVVLVDFVEQKIMDLAEKYQKDPSDLLKAKSRHRPLADLGKISDPAFWKNILADNKVKAVEDDWAIDSYMQPIDAVFEIINSLKRNGYGIAVLSNDSREMSAARRQKYGFDSLFDDVIISCEHGVVKPGPEIYRIALKRMHCLPGDCVFIDDRQENLDTAADIGMHTILFQNADQLKNEMSGLGVNLA